MARPRIGFGLDSNPLNRGGIAKGFGFDSIKCERNLDCMTDLDWRWAGCYGEITVRCLFCIMFCPK